MKSIAVFITIFLCSSSFIYSQGISCTELLRAVKSEGYNFSTVGGMALVNSSWLREVKAYKLTVDYEEVIFVVAEIKRSENSYTYDTYVFCGVPSRNWNDFQRPSYGGKSYGTSFHENIMDYQCNCN